MSPNAQHFADRLRSALGFHTHRAKHVSTGRSETDAQRPRSTATYGAEQPGEAFARRLREAAGLP